MYVNRIYLVFVIAKGDSNWKHHQQQNKQAIKREMNFLIKYFKRIKNLQNFLLIFSFFKFF